MNLKLKIGILGLITSISISTYAFFGIGTGTAQVALLKSILAQNTANTTSQLAQQAKQVLQFEKQLEELKLHYQQLQALGKDVTDLNVKELMNKIITIDNYNKNLINILEREQTKIDNVSKYISLHQDEWKKNGSWSAEDIAKAETQLKNMRDEIKNNLNKANYNLNSGTYSTRKNDVTTIKKNLENINSTTGALSAIQGIGQMLAQTNELITDVKDLLRGMQQIEITNQQGQQTEQDMIKQAAQDQKDENEKISEEMKKWNKPLPLKLKF